MAQAARYWRSDHVNLGKPIIVCLPDVDIEPRSSRPIGSWINHPLVKRVDTIEDAILPVWKFGDIFGRVYEALRK